MQDVAQSGAAVLCLLASVSWANPAGRGNQNLSSPESVQEVEPQASFLSFFFPRQNIVKSGVWSCNLAASWIEYLATGMFDVVLIIVLRQTLRGNVVTCRYTI